MDAGTLQAAISEVCPVSHTTVVVADDRSTWSFEPASGATQQQITDGNQVIATIGTETVPTTTSSDFILRFTNDEYLLLKQQIANGGTALAGRVTPGGFDPDIALAKAWDIVVGLGAINLNTPNANLLKDKLVADGILTQARADEVFGAAPARSTRWL